MNLVEALDTALPQLPVRAKREHCPRIYPKIIAREQIEEGAPVVVAALPDNPNLYRFSPGQWQLIQLCNGRRNYQQIIEAYRAETGSELSLDEIREFVANLDEIDFWYRTPQERNVRLTDELAEERRKALRSRYADLSSIEFSAWDPDVFLGKLHNKVSFFFSGWYTAIGAGLFAFMIYVFVGHWSAIISDTLRFYNFTEKSAGDLVTFWALLFVISFMHECAHGISCKHYGASVHRMGLNLVYLTPCFFVDASEAWIFATRWERLRIVLAGMWSEMIVCSLATMVWLASPPGSYLHELSYNVILITGVGVIVINMNPLIKLDGYYAFSDLLGVTSLKENSTAYVSNWIKRHVFGLPVEVEYLSPRLRWLYMPYAVISGIYSYTLLFVAVRLAFNIFRGFNETFALLVAALLTYKIFKSRMRTLVRFMKTVYLDKKERLQAWLSPARLVAMAAAVLVLLFAPMWRDSITVPFIMEASQRAVLRAEVPGTVEAVLAAEGDHVDAGAVLLRLRNLDLESEVDRTKSDLRVAQDRANAAHLTMRNFAQADLQRNRLRQVVASINNQQQKLTLDAPIAGTVMTPRLHDLLGKTLAAGSTAAEVDNLAILRARLYVPEFQMRYARPGAPVSLKPDNRLGSRAATIEAVAPAPSAGPSSLFHGQTFQGIGSVAYYVVSTTVENSSGELRPGEIGLAKIYMGHRSLAGLAARPLRDMMARKLW